MQQPDIQCELNPIWRNWPFVFNELPKGTDLRHYFTGVNDSVLSHGDIVEGAMVVILMMEKRLLLEKGECLFICSVYSIVKIDC